MTDVERRTVTGIVDDRLARALGGAMLALRITLGIFLLQWGFEKFVVPQNTVGIWQHFYGMSIPAALGYLFGAVEIAIAICIFLAVLRTVAYGAALVLHTISMVVSWPPLLNPWAEPVNHLFIAGLPVWGAFLALFLLRHCDRGFRRSPRPA